MATVDAEKNAAPEKKQDIVDLVGGDGPWQRRIFLVLLFFAIPLASHNMSMSFLAPNLDHWCTRPPDSNFSVEEWKDIGLPPGDKKCSRYKVVDLSHKDAIISNHSLGRKVLTCDSWEYDDSFYTATVLSEWNLVCDREWLVSMSKSIFIAGYLFSVLLFGHLSDRYGRRTVIAICNFIAVVSAIVCAFSVSFLMFAVARFFIAVGVAGAFTTSFVLLMEVIGSEFRSSYGIGINFGWLIGYMSLPAIAWFLRDWFWIQIVISIPSVLLLPSWWLLPESPRWLLAHGKADKALKVLQKAGSTNGIELSNIDVKLKEMISKTSKAHETENVSGNILQLWTLGLCRKTSIIFYAWFVITFVYYGLSYNTNDLAGDPFVNFALYGLVEFPANLLSLFAIRILGRRNPLAFSLAIGGAACLIMYPIPEDPWWLSVVVSLFGKFCISCSFAILYVFTAEIFPTVVRNVAFGSASTCGRLGSIIAPFVRELGYATHPVLPQVIFGILALTGGCLVLLLPETNNLSVPDTLQEAAEIL